MIKDVKLETRFSNVPRMGPFPWSSTGLEVYPDSYQTSEMKLIKINDVNDVIYFSREMFGRVLNMPLWTKAHWNQIVNEFLMLMSLVKYQITFLKLSKTQYI